MLAFMTEALPRGLRITVPTCVVGEWWAKLDLVLTTDLDDLSRIRDRAFPRVRLRRV